MLNFGTKSQGNNVAQRINMHFFMVEDIFNNHRQQSACSVIWN